jgi:hypothetical protein
MIIRLLAFSGASGMRFHCFPWVGGSRFGKHSFMGIDSWRPDYWLSYRRWITKRRSTLRSFPQRGEWQEYTEKFPTVRRMPIYKRSKHCNYSITGKYTRIYLKTHKLSFTNTQQHLCLMLRSFVYQWCCAFLLSDRFYIHYCKRLSPHLHSVTNGHSPLLRSAYSGIRPLLPYSLAFIYFAFLLGTGNGIYSLLQVMMSDDLD